MGLAHSPRIVTDNLVLALDAANQKSWGDNGSTWQDMSGKGNNVTLTNGPLHSQGPFLGAGYVTFDGTDDYLTTTYSSSEFRWWDTDYTIEAWIYPTTLTDWYYSTISSLVGNMDPSGITNYWSFGPYNSSGNVKFYYWNGSQQDAMVSTESVTANSWNHIAFIKNSSGCKIFVNGVGTDYMSISGTPQDSTSYNLTVGAYNNADINGYVSNLRVVRGTALYTSNFTVPKKPLKNISNTKLLTCQGSSITDASDSSHNIAVTGNSTAVYNNDACFEFDGSNDYVREDTILDTFTSTSDPWSVECWFNTDVNPSSVECMIGINYNNGAENTLLLGVVDNGGCKLNVYYRNNEISSNTTVTVGQWHHVVATHTGGSMQVYLDGTQILNNILGVNRTLNTCAFLIGAELDGTNSLGNYFDGKISNVKMYNKTLTATEVAQNFNALKGRYGI